MRVTAEAKTATRKRILQAARRLFAQEGFDTATTRDIARSAEIAVGTLFNYFPTKESLALCLASESHAEATEEFLERRSAEAAPSLEESLFAYVAAGLRKLKPYRKYLPAVLEESNGDAPLLRTVHLETVARIVTAHGGHQWLSSLALQMYWTLYAGVLAHWASDSSPKQEDTLALLDQSLAMFVGWLKAQPQQSGE